MPEIEQSAQLGEQVDVDIHIDRRGDTPAPRAAWLREKAVDETLDVAGVDRSIAIGVAGA